MKQDHSEEQAGLGNRSQAWELGMLKGKDDFIGEENHGR